MSTRTTRAQAMVPFKFVYWCTSHQQCVEPKARKRLQDKLHCKIVKLNLTLLRQIDFHKLSTWIDFKDQAESGL